MSFNFDFETFKKDIPDFDERIKNGDIFMPKEISQLKNLSANEKLYLSAYLNYNKNIIKTDDYIKQTISNVTLIKIKKKLSKLGYIDCMMENINNPEIAKELTIKHSHKGFICEWCGQESYILQEHHFPIPKRKGGKDTVRICPNCHYTYHKLMNNKMED